MPTRVELPDGIEIIDVDLFGSPGLSCSYLIHGSEPTLVETGPATVAQTVFEKLTVRGVEPKHVVLTHIHLDHAGGAGHVADMFPGAHIWVHEIGAPHVVDPSRLVASARRLFGDALDSLYGEPIPVDDARLTAISDGDKIPLGDRELRVLYTPGHARHEVTLFDADSGCAFIGDSAGVYLGDDFQKPATPPPEFNLEHALDSINKIKNLNASAICFTHYGPADEASLEQAAADLVTWDGVLRPLALVGATDEEMFKAIDNVIDSYPGSSDYQSAAGVMNSSRNSVLGYARYYRKLFEPG